MNEVLNPVKNVVLNGIGDPLQVEAITNEKKLPDILTPSVILTDPRYPHNVGGALRACACWGLPQLWWSGDRVKLDYAKGERLPREERMKGYKHVQLHHDNRVLDRIPRDATPVCVELLPTSQPLETFDHPDNPIYIFGPEDGSVPIQVRRHCHHFIFIPTHFCLNLAAAVNVVLYDRLLKRIWAGKEEVLSINDRLKESRGPQISNS
jgi:tRNA(Leu) C34 or U34 (ribose-2'-O)-methylase TrmL